MWDIIQEQQLQLNALGDAMDQSGSLGSLSWSDKTSVGGYGELHYNNWNNQLSGGSDRERIDFHRFVLFFNHEFSDRVRFFSEFELEHALVSDTDTDTDTDFDDTRNLGGPGGDEFENSVDTSPGEVELEQAYVEIDITDNHLFRGGLFLIPIGILNETHEPPTFYGVERNSVEARIIPSTWWEGGLGVSGKIIPEGGLTYDLALTSGLAVGNNYSIRGGRQKVANAALTDPAATGRLKWARPGLELAGTLHWESDITQDGAAGATDSSSAILYEIHTVIEKGPFGIRALYAEWDLSGDRAKTLGRDDQEGAYIEPSFKINDHFGIFARYSFWDEVAGSSADTEIEQFDVGINWWPHQNVVFKFDYQNQDTPTGTTEFDGINLGFGYNF